MKQLKNLVSDFEEWFSRIFEKMNDDSQAIRDILEIATNDVASGAKKVEIIKTDISFKKREYSAEHTIAYWDRQKELFNLTLWLTIRADGLISYRFRYKGSDKFYYAGNKGLLKIFFYLKGFSPN